MKFGWKIQSIPQQMSPQEPTRSRPGILLDSDVIDERNWHPRASASDSRSKWPCSILDSRSPRVLRADQLWQSRGDSPIAQGRSDRFAVTRVEPRCLRQSSSNRQRSCLRQVVKPAALENRVRRTETTNQKDEAPPARDASAR